VRSTDFLQNRPVSSIMARTCVIPRRIR
jgi:hypothetical protein